MHLYFFVRGIKSQVDLWLSLAQGHFWKWTRRNLKTNKDEVILVQGALRPSVLGSWEYIIPEDCLAEALAVLSNGDWDNPKSLKLATLRKIIGLKPIPKKIREESKKINPSVVMDNIKRGLSHNHVEGVAVHIIGIKYDDRKECKEWGYEQEML